MRSVATSRKLRHAATDSASDAGGSQPSGAEPWTEPCLPDTQHPGTVNVEAPNVDTTNVDAASADSPDYVSRIAALIRQRWAVKPRVGIILGTGLSSLASQITRQVAVSYAELPGFPRSTALGHRGQWVCGQLAGQSVIAMDGRFHLYEGYSSAQIVLPVRVMRALGAELLIVSNASGGLNPQYRSGDLMVVVGHINLLGIRGGTLACGPPLPSRSAARPIYDEQLAHDAREAALRLGIGCHLGNYVSVLGPNYETRAEYRYLRQIGGDAVGMSSVPESLAAAQCGLRVLALSIITNVACPDAPATVRAQEVVDAAAMAEPRMRAVVLEILATRLR